MNQVARILFSIFMNAFYYCLILPMGLLMRGKILRNRSHGWRPWRDSQADGPLIRLFAKAAAFFAADKSREVTRPWVSPEVLAETTLKNYHALGAMCKGEDRHFLLAFQPYLYLSDKEKTDLERKLFSLRQGERLYGYDYLNYVQAFKKRIDSSIPDNPMIDYVDLTGSFDERDDHMFLDTVHVSDKGNRVMAELLAEKIIKSIESKEKGGGA